MARATLKTRGTLAAGALDVSGVSTLTGAVDITGALTVTALVFNGAGTDPGLTGNNSVFVVTNPLAAKPSADRGVAFGLVSNSTGVAVVVNSTGTTWKYLNVTSIQPT